MRTDPSGLIGKVVAVTGASEGIGLATAKLFHDAGATVALLARRPQPLADAATQVGERAIAIPTDVSDPGQVRDAFARITSELGRLDILINNAAVGAAAPIEEMSDELIERVIGTSLLGPIYCTREAIPLIKAAGGGDIVFVGSEVIHAPHPPLHSMYVTAKSGLAAFAKTALDELRREGIRVTHCVVGRVATSFGTNALISAEHNARFREAIAREGYYEKAAGTVKMSPEDVADMLLICVTRPPSQMIDVVHVRSWT
jgi:NAD(P)-dependent dehydrogenase (short-subunit alcohol dehydrogenase family)